MNATRRHLPLVLLLLLAGLGSAVATGCSARALPKSLFIIPKHYVNAGTLQGRRTRFVRRLDETLSFGRIHAEGLVHLNFPNRIEVERYLETALIRSGADAVTNLEMTFYDMVIPFGTTLFIPMDLNICEALDGWIGIPFLRLTVHVARVRLEGDLVTIEDAPAES